MNKEELKKELMELQKTAGPLSFLRSLKGAAEELAGAGRAIQKGMPAASTQIELMRKELRDELASTRKTLKWVGLGAGPLAAATHAAVSPYARRVHKELQEIEKSVKLPIAGDLPEQEAGGFVRGVKDVLFKSKK